MSVLAGKDVVYLDFETRSRLNVKDAGAYRYASDHTTEILCLALGHTTRTDPENRYVFRWSPFSKAEDSNICLIRGLIAKADYVVAHNAAFDRLIYECVAVSDHSFPPLEVGKWYCSSAQARVNALPASLDDATRAIGTMHRKDHTGARLLRKFSMPDKKTGKFNTPEGADFVALVQYCADDVHAMMDLVANTRQLTEDEFNSYIVNERINDQGILVDFDVALAAEDYAKQEVEEIGDELKLLTAGAVTRHTQTVRAAQWVHQELTPGPAADLLVTKTNKLSLAKDIRATLLARDDIPDHVKPVLERLDEGNKSSVAKFKRMQQRADIEDDRVRGAFVYAGAGQTQRFASRGLQLHNLTRDCFNPDEAEAVRAQMLKGSTLTDPQTGKELPVMLALSKMLRPTLIPDDDAHFVVSDWSSIEARAAPWLSCSASGENKLDIFRRNEDPYKHAAASIYRVNYEGVTKDQRQIGKVAELALGFLGGAGAFDSMAKNYGVSLPKREVDSIVANWRKANRWAEHFGKRCMDAAMAAMRNPHTPYEATRHVCYIFDAELMGGTLKCKLPGGLTIQYPQARLEVENGPYGAQRVITCMKASLNAPQGAKEWPRMKIWPGILVENNTQAVCGHLLRYSLKNAFQQGLNVVGHVHDEIIVESAIEHAHNDALTLKNIMCEGPSWAEGLPLTAVPEIMTRYGK